MRPITIGIVLGLSWISGCANPLPSVESETEGSSGGTTADGPMTTNSTTETGPVVPGDSTAIETGITEPPVDSSESGDRPPTSDCMGAGEGAGADGDVCTANSDCASGVCTIFTDVPLNVDAVCAPTPDACGTRVTGTIFDFSTGGPVDGANLVVAAALQAATNPTGAMALVEATSDADGRVDSTSAAAISTPLGIVGLASADGYYLTATGLAVPGPDMQSYEVGTRTHDMWMVPEGDLTDWSDALSGDPDVLAEDLPLGDAGGIVGFVRDGVGAGIPGVVVASTSDSTDSVVRYLNDDGTFSDTETSDLGIFVILRPGVPEDFEATLDGASLGGGTAGSANGAVYTLIIDGG